MTLRIDEGFEDPGYEEFSDGSTGTGSSIDDQNQDITIDDDYVCKMVSTGNNVYIQRTLADDTIPATSLFYFYIKFRASAWSDNDGIPFYLYDNDNNLVVRGKTENSGGSNILRLNYYNNGGFVNQDCSQVIALNTTYELEILYDPVDNTFEAWIDDTQQFTAITLTGTTRPGLRYIRVGQTNSDGWAGTLYVDSIKVDDADRIGGSASLINCTTDALTLTEYSANVNASTEIAATLDALTLTEYNAVVTLVADTDVDINATTEQLTLTEYSATVDADTELAATTDQLLLTEYNAIVTTDNSVIVEATTESLTLTEYSATIDADTEIAATTDSLLLTEYNATVVLSNNILATTDALILTEYDATVVATPATSASFYEDIAFNSIITKTVVFNSIITKDISFVSKLNN